LNRVEGGPLEQVVRDDPHGEPVLDSGILADPADEGGELACRFDRSDVAARLALVDDHHAGRLPQYVAGFLDRNRLLELYVHSLGVADEDGHACARGRYLDLGIQDLLRLGHHLPFLFRVAVLHEDVDVRNDVEGDLLRELLRLDLLAWDVLALGLVPQLVHGLFAGARDGLVGRDDYALDRRVVVQRFQDDHHLCGRAVRVGNDILLAEVLHRLRIHLRHDQRHVLVVTPGRGIIDYRAAGCGDPRSPLLRYGAARRHEAEVRFLEVELLEVEAFERFLAVADFRADRAPRRDREDLVRRKLPLRQNIQHLAAHVARGADNSDLVAHLASL